MSKVIRGWRFATPRGSRLSTRLLNPTGLSTRISGSSVILTWSDSSQKSSKTIVYISSDAGMTWTTPVTTLEGITTYTFTNLSDGSYQFAVAATSTAGTKSKTTPVSVVLPVVNTPTGLTATGGSPTVNVPTSFTTSASGTTINISWTDTNSNTAQTVIDRSTDSGSTWTNGYTTVTAGTNSYSDTGLSDGIYTYRARALIGSTYSASYTSSQSATISTGSFSLNALYTFGGGTNGSATGVINYANSGQVESTYYGTTGTSYSNAQTRGGRSTSLRSNILSGTDGEVLVGTRGRFGLNITLPTTVRCVDGDTLHFIMAIYFDSNFDSHTNTGLLKFIRTLSVANSYGHLDHCLINNYGYIEGDTPSAGPDTPHGWMWGNESDHSGETWKSGYGYASGIKSNRNITRGQWCIVEHRQKFSTNAATASRTTWVDGQFVADFTGNTKTYINASGNLATLTGGQCVSIGAGVTMDTMRIFTYWNGNSPQTQGVYIDALGFYRIPSGQAGSLPNTDAYGNKFIGLGVI